MKCCGGRGSAVAWTLATVAAVLLSSHAIAQRARPADPHAAAVIDHWTSERRAAAIPRDLVIDPRGLGYLRLRDGALVPHGHLIAAQSAPTPRAQPPSGDTTPPTIANSNPAAGAVIGAAYTFSATVVDASEVRSVTFQLQKNGSPAQSFSATKASGSDVWSVSLQGFTDGNWSWTITAKDRAKGGGNTATYGPIAFQVSTGSGGGGGGGTVTDAEWTGGGTIQQVAGRIYFEMPSNARRKGPWSGYVCSGTVATDETNGRSVIVTAAHCVHDDVNKAFARNVLFIPNQASTSGAGTDLECSNDPMGCWIPSLGVVDVNWTTRTFPDNVAWDYAFYVVKDTGMHQGAAASSEGLDVAAGSLGISFNVPVSDAAGSNSDFTHALGYSYDSDPLFMYCAEDMTTEGTANWWLPSCGLTGGSSGGPWIQPMDPGTGTGPIISVNSWGYTNQPGMAGPKLYGTSAACLFAEAKSTALLTSTFPDGDAGVPLSCP
jgi:hypothetical protein